MIKGVSIRPMDPGDAETAAETIRTAFGAQMRLPDPPPSALKVSADDIRAHFAAGGLGWIAETETGAVGAALAMPRPDGSWYISRVAVLLAFRRMGVALFLLRTIETAARDRGIPALTLETRLDPAIAARLFASEGFEEVSRHTHPGYASPTYMLMAKPLRAGETTTWRL